MPSVAIVTCQEFPELDDEDRLLIPALAELGIEATPAVWTDDTVDWSSFDMAVVRETWDYAEHRDRFLAWAQAVSGVSTLANDVELITWNTDKRYLAELAEAGVPVVSTRFLAPGDDVSGWRPDVDSAEVVVKPSVSCGSRDTLRHSAQDDVEAIRAHVQRLLDDGRDVMVQPYLEDVDTAGETALIYIDGIYSHAIRKGPMLARGVEGEKVNGLFVQEQIDPREPSVEELQVAERVMAALPADAPLYARVDLIPDENGAPTLLELELTEPSLFLSFSALAPGRLAAAIAARIPAAATDA